MNRKIYTTILAIFMVSALFAADIVIKDADLGSATYEWTNDNVYILDGYVYLEDGGVLNIEAGTVIKGMTVPSNGTDETSALIITRGAKINAEGTRDEPIIFTAELDDLSTTTDLTATTNLLWGGVIILGRAPIGENINNPAENYPTDIVEGIPSDEIRIRYGGTDAMDDSGILRYVSIRHGGSILGGDNEINGLTLGGVGAGTTIDYVEVFANIDDGFEFFGGTVNATHIVSAFVGDEAFDFDESWNGHVQFAFAIQQDADPEIGDHAIEYDGSEADDLGPKTVGRIYNATLIGSGSQNNGNGNGLRLKSDGAAEFWNIIWMDLDDYAFRVENTSVDRLNNGETVFAANLLWNYNTLYNGTGFSVNFEEADPMLASISRIPNQQLDPRPISGSPALTGAAEPTEEGVVVTSFRGAFGPAWNWADDWTALSSYGYFGDIASSTHDLASNNAGVVLANAEPNPVYKDQAQFNFELPKAGDAFITVFNLQGQLVDRIDLGFQAEGKNAFQLNVADYQSGLYIVALNTELGNVTQKVMVYN